jgi:pimeloyl-ACP methyl ester carboxylesterase
VLIHGAAVTHTVWTPVIAQLHALGVTAPIHAPQRRYSGDLDVEMADLLPLCDDALVVGVSGGATLGLELAARGAPFTSAILHEPAVGSLLPELLAPMAVAFARGGVELFATTLYGRSWHRDLAPDDDEATRRDLAMFRAFEPRHANPCAGSVLVTVGERSPAIRHEAAALLRDRCGYSTAVLPGSSHAAHLDSPRQLAALIRDVLTTPV